ncbi:NAD-dependent deacylase [Brevibacillus humidisoli]|uniref:NAD-dependent deacylase n=1 Tax=Brevibacillus humidisoli TaxID=2895522 RepID=UPI001E2A1C5F|nr:NAD-dependent deacylase [Brevibacillus humidisoli]UFJ39253.1 NAD-dependent deacylase [Brevibacillus humidisoli]
MIERWLRQSKQTVIFTGAGMSTESGLPDFRSARQGLWRGKDPAMYASTHALEYNRALFVDFYRMRIEGLLACQPHIGHRIIADWQQRGLVSAIITQNVDGYHQQAGSQDVIELHGSLRTVRCLACGRRYPAERYLQEDGTRCTCGGFLRPEVVLFGEMLPEQALQAAEREMANADLCIVLGSSLQVSPANLYPQIAKQNGARLVIVNMEPTELDDLADQVVHDCKIGDWLQRMDQALRQ